MTARFLLVFLPLFSYQLGAATPQMDSLSSNAGQDGPTSRKVNVTGACTRYSELEVHLYRPAHGPAPPQNCVSYFMVTRTVQKAKKERTTLSLLAHSIIV